MGTLVEDALSMADWIAAALTSSGYAADFSPSSLREVERFFEDQSADGKLRRGGLLAEDTSKRVFAIGAYTG